LRVLIVSQNVHGAVERAGSDDVANQIFRPLQRSTGRAATRTRPRQTADQFEAFNAPIIVVNRGFSAGPTPDPRSRSQRFPQSTTARHLDGHSREWQAANALQSAPRRQTDVGGALKAAACEAISSVERRAINSSKKVFQEAETGRRVPLVAFGELNKPFVLVWVGRDAGMRTWQTFRGAQSKLDKPLDDFDTTWLIAPHGTATLATLFRKYSKNFIGRSIASPKLR
jgi:hypothetical protein